MSWQKYTIFFTHTWLPICTALVFIINFILNASRFSFVISMAKIQQIRARAKKRYLYKILLDNWLISNRVVACSYEFKIETFA